MYNLLTGDYPFKDAEKEILYKKILKSGFDFPENIKISEAAKDLIKQILVKEPRKRPSLVQILYHDFFHIYKFPKFFSPSTLVAPPDIKEYNPDINEDEIIKKEVKLKNLCNEVIPDIFEIRYEDINNYILKDESQFEVFENWISYLHKSNTFNFYYYEVNNGTIGIIYENRESILYNKKNKKVYYITPKDNREDEIKSYDEEMCPDDLQLKFKRLLKYYSDNSENKIEKEDNSNENSDKKNKSQKTIFYIKRLEDDENAYFLYLTNDIEQIKFKNKVEIIMSDKKDKLIYVDKDKKRNIIPTFNILNNTNKKLTSKLRYIRYHSNKKIKNNMFEKFKKNVDCVTRK